MSVESYGESPESLTQELLVGKLLVGGLGVVRSNSNVRSEIRSRSSSCKRKCLVTSAREKSLRDSEKL